MPFIAFLCYQNVAAAQIAEGLCSQMSLETIKTCGVTILPAPNPIEAVRALAEIGVDISTRRCRALTAFQKRGFDLIIMLEPQAQDFCSDLPGRETVIHWDIPVPPENQPVSLEYCRQVRDLLKNKITVLFTEGYINTILALKRNQEIMLDDFPEGIIVHDIHRRISFFNHAAEAITGYKRQDILGRDCHTVFEHGFCAGQCSFCEPNPPQIDKANYPLNLISQNGRPKKLDMLVTSIKNLAGNLQGILACFRDITEVSDLRRRLHNETHFRGIIGQDSKMQAIFQLIEDLAASDCAVLIQGESGTGKELVANAINGEGLRSGKPFISVNCGALPEGVLESELFGHVKGAFTGAVRDKKGRFELADGGTLFLDEVGELTPNMQVKLLRVLQEGTFEPVGGEKTIKVNVRVISATNKDLRELIKKGLFREDLFYRLCVVPLTLPPLRDRRNDIPLLINHIIGVFNERTGHTIEGVSKAALALMMDHPWTGNIREMQNAIQYAFVKCKNQLIEAEHLPPEIAGQALTNGFINIKPARRKRKRKLTADQIRAALDKVQGNKAEAARILNIGRATLYRTMHDSGLE